MSLSEQTASPVMPKISMNLFIVQEEQVVLREADEAIALVQAHDAAGVALEGTDYWTPAIQGNFSIFLLGGTVYSAPYGTNGAGIGQTAQISPTAQSITYWGASGNSLQISFAGQMLLFKAMSADGNHTVYGADISAYAGQTGELLFHAPWATGGGLVDNIQFSDQPIPEPRAVSMFAVGGMIFAWRFVRKQLSGKEVLRPG